MGVVGGDRRRGSRSRNSQDGPFPLHHFPGLSGPHKRKQQSPQHLLFAPLFFPAPLRVLPPHSNTPNRVPKCILEAAISPTNGSRGTSDSPTSEVPISRIWIFRASPQDP